MNVEVVFLPPIATGLESKLCVVIDVLRATSTLVSMFGAGARKVVLAESIPEALEYAEAQGERPVVCGESGGLRPPGFDRGNSPREFRPGSLEGRVVAFCTSNGTKAMRTVAAAPVVLTGSLLNGSAVVRAAVREARERELDIALICSGDRLGTRFAIDDAFCAGHLLSLIQREAARAAGTGVQAAGVERPVGSSEGEAGEQLRLEESVTAALRLYRSYGAERGMAGEGDALPRDAILEAFWESRNARGLRQVGLAEDVDYCAQLDISSCVPRLRHEDGRLVLYPQ